MILKQARMSIFLTFFYFIKKFMVNSAKNAIMMARNFLKSINPIGKKLTMTFKLDLNEYYMKDESALRVAYAQEILGVDYVPTYMGSFRDMLIKQGLVWDDIILPMVKDALPFLSKLNFKINRDGMSDINAGSLNFPSSGMNSTFESLLHEIGHCFYFIDKKRLERAKFKNFGFTHGVEPKLRLNSYQNELWAGAYELKMMRMAGIVDDQIEMWLRDYKDSFHDLSLHIEKEEQDLFVEQILNASNGISDDDIFQHVNVLHSFIESTIIA